MKIIINGQAGTYCHDIALKLASRLALDCITSTSCFPQSCFDTDNRLHRDYKLHKDSEIDALVDSAIKEELSKRDDNFLLYSYNGIFLVPDAIRILLVTDLQCKPALAATMEMREADIKHAYKGAFVESNYDIVINTFSCTHEEIIECIIKALESGHYGKYVPLNILLPTRSNDITVRSYYNIGVGLYVYKGCKFIRPSSMDVAISYARAGIKLIPVYESEVIDFAILKKKDYTAWFDRINVDPADAMNYLNFAIYCFAYGYSNHERVFYDLCSNGNPYKRIEAEGIHIN